MYLSSVYLLVSFRETGTINKGLVSYNVARSSGSSQYLCTCYKSGLPLQLLERTISEFLVMAVTAV